MPNENSVHGESILRSTLGSKNKLVADEQKREEEISNAPKKVLFRSGSWGIKYINGSR